MFLPLIISFLLSIFSTAVMSYISMATPIGPWIAPTIVLIAMLLYKILCQKMYGGAIAHITAAASIGGILATGFGFSFPTLYFLDQSFFMSLMARPLFFSTYVTGIALAAGSFGFLLANLFENSLIVQQKLPFPIGALVHEMISAGNQIRKAYELMAGFFGTALFCILQEGFLIFQGVIPKSATLIRAAQFGALRIPLVRFDFWPMLWAIGFITGHVIAVPLGVGAVLKVAVIDPINHVFFAQLSTIEFVFMFCSGMALFSAIMSVMSMPKLIKQFVAYFDLQKIKSHASMRGNFFSRVQLGESLLLLGVCISILTMSSFSFLQQLYLLGFTGLFTYQMAVIAGKWGIAPLGRFATFVMLPAMLLFNVSLVHIVLIATFVEVCGGVAVDILFNRKVGRLMQLDMVKVKRYQYFGLIVSALTVGGIFWVLIHSCGLGSAQLFAYKAQSRQLLINAFKHGKDFNYYVMFLGLVLSFILTKVKINPMLVLGGLLMPLNLSLGLIFGGGLSLLVKDKREWEPFWSGVFASNSLWMLIKAII